MKVLSFLSFTVISMAAFQARGAAKIRLDSVAPEYRPTAGVGMPEPVSMESYTFEVNKATQRARIVVDYTYPDQVAFGSDGGIGPKPTVVQIPGLKYDAASKSVVYENGGSKTVCASVRERHGLLHSLSVKPTGACVVTASTAKHEVDNGWTISHTKTVDTYFEVR